MSSSSAMSLPPHSIRVKRQRNDDPVPALYIENAKRRRLSKEFVFRLARTVDSPVGDREVPPSPKKQDTTRGRGASTSTVTSPTTTTTTTTADDAKDAASVIASPTSDPMAISPTLPSAQPPLVKAGGKAQDVKDAALSRPRTPTPMVKTTADTNAAAAAMTMDPDLLSPGTKTEIRRFHLSKRVKLDPYGHGASSPTGGKKRERNVISVFMEGSGRVAKKRSLNRLEYVKGGRDGIPEGTTPSIKLTEPGDERRKPKTHPMEKAMIEQRKSREHSRSREEDGGSEYHTPQEQLPVQPQAQQQQQQQQQQLKQQKGKQDWELETDELTQQLQAMVMDYIANQPATNLTPSAAKETEPIRKKKPSSSRTKVEPPAKSDAAAAAESTAMERSASAVDTADSKLTLDDAAADPGLLPDDAEGDWVYDVYVREELKPELDATGQLVSRGEDYGVLVISNSDDEEWWYEDDDDSDNKVWNSDDEDSNAEDYHTNDYPDEDSASDLEEYDYNEGFRRRGLVTKGGRRITTADDEEYDLNDDVSSDDADDESDGDEMSS